MEKTQLKNILTKIGETNPKYTLDKQVYNFAKLVRFIDNPSEEMKQAAMVQEDPSSIQYIENPSEIVQLAAVEEDPYSIQYIQNPTEKVKQLAKSKWSADDEAQDYYTFGKHKI